MNQRSQPVKPGDQAPAFELASVADPGRVITLDDFRGRAPLFLALMVGLWCPFCRRQLAQMGPLQQRLSAIGVETLVVVATGTDNARLYFRFRPTPLALAADPELTTHRAYGVPKPEPTPALLQALETIKVNPDGSLPEPMPVSQAGKYLQDREGYSYTPDDQRDVQRQWPQLKGQFLIDRGGVVGWSYIECGDEGLAGIGKLPANDTVVEAARKLG
jgi:peroxiredoxin